MWLNAAAHSRPLPLAFARSAPHAAGNAPGSARPEAAGNEGRRGRAPPSRLSKGAEMAGWTWLRLVAEAAALAHARLSFAGS